MASANVEKAAGQAEHDVPSTGGTSNDAPEELKPGVLKRFWQSSGLTVGQVLIMFKYTLHTTIAGELALTAGRGALPPSIALAAYQAESFAEVYTNVGYLVAIMALFGFCILPRAKFVQTMFLNTLFVCIGAAVATLEMFCSVKARTQSGPSASTANPGATGSKQALAYSSSASAVSAVWLFFTVYISNTIRANRPQLQVPVIVYSIFTIVVSLYSPLFAEMSEVYAFVKRLLSAFLTGFAFATGVSLFVFPTTSRKIVEIQIGGFLKLTSASLAAQRRYFDSISRLRKESEDQHWSDLSEEGKPPPDAKAMKAVLTQLAGLFGKIDGEIVFAKREAAYGKLQPEHYKQIVHLLRAVLMPVAGMTTFIDIIQSVKQKKKENFDAMDSEETIDAIRHFQYEEWSEVMAASHGPFVRLTETMQEAILHILYTLELEKKPKANNDLEAKGDRPLPGDKEYSAHLEKALGEFGEHRKATLQAWCEKKGISLPTTFWDDPDYVTSMKDNQNSEQNIRLRHNQQQLYLVLYVGYLTFSIGKSLLALLLWADARVDDGTMKKKRLTVPAAYRFKKWFLSLLATDNDDTEDSFATGTETANVWVGDSLKSKKDPEHLPPVTFYQKMTSPLRLIPKFLGSEGSAYGFRVACATMSLGIIGFLHQTQYWYVKQRGLWASIMIAISMGSHTGQGIFGFLMKISGTAIAMVSSLVVWYISDQQTAAILPVLYIFSVPWFYVVLKYPKFIQAAVISMVTPLLIIGYELQVRRLGEKAATSNGQPAYPVYELAPYRLATVVAGLFVAFIWTYFPFPITTRRTLRKEVGAMTYLLANYYSCIHTTTKMRLTDGVTGEEEDKKGTPAYRLKKARAKVFSKLIVLFVTAQENSNLTRLEPNFGGQFPKKTYDDLILSLRHIWNYIGMIAYATNTFVSASPEGESEWLKDFRSFANETSILSHDITSMLCMLSAAVTNGTPLAPYLKPPRSYSLDERMEAIDPELLSAKHISEPCYAAFAVLQVASSLISEELRTTISLVKQLVGEVDFSFHVINTSDDSHLSTKSAESESTGIAGHESKGKGAKKD